MDERLIEYFQGDTLAAGVWLGKYAQEGEVTPDDMHKRMAKEFGRIEMYHHYKKGSKFYNDKHHLLSDYGREREFLSTEKIYSLFKDFKYIIPQGSVMSQLGAKSIGSLSNCFVIGQPEDSYGGIFQKDQEQVQLMKRRGGVGIDISTLRPTGTGTTNAAKTSTGAVSFLHRYSNSTREVAQNGRRGALMASIDINHPDVMEFIKIKRDLTQVTGANISIKLNSEFMKAVENDEEYLLRFPCDFELAEYIDISGFEYNTLIESLDEKGNKIYTKKIKAKEYWEEIIKSAHGVAEPGLMFWDAMVNYSPDGVYPQFKQVTTNPCSEIGMQPYDACRLIVLNYLSFVKNPYTGEAKFDYDEFYKIAYEALRLNDDLVDLEVEHINRILQKIDNDPESEENKRVERELWNKVKDTAKASRRTGLGFTALGDTLAALGVKYDSVKAKKIIEMIQHTKMRSELDCSTDMAITRGTFRGWDVEKEFDINTTFSDGVKVTTIEGRNDFYRMINEKFPEQVARMIKYGRRNVSWSCIAPTGTVSLMTGTTSGIEPIFQPFYTRRKKVNPGENIRVDFVDQNGDSWQEFAVLHPKFKDWLIGYVGLHGGYTVEDYSAEELQKLFKESPWYGSTANDINWIQRVEIQAICQTYTTHSISSTVNLPEDISLDAVSEIYMESWKRGLKGITVYRDGSRSGVLVNNDTKKDEVVFEQTDSVERPRELMCDIHSVTAKGVKWNVIVGLLDDLPYETFVVPHFTTMKGGYISKEGKGRYDLLTKDMEIYSEDICSEMKSEEESVTRLVSSNLRHRTHIKHVVDQLNKSYGDITSFSKALARVLKKYIPNGEKSGVKCNDCGSSNVIFEEGCNKCLDCGNSKCS